jgi:hypothetical protein
MTVNLPDGSYRYPVPSNARRTRVIRYGLKVSANFSATATAAFWTAAIWPIHGQQIQVSFFLSLVASVLTLFGLVFTLCLIGTQLIATRTKITVARIFGFVTWLDLALFLATTLWTLVISYYAGEPNASSRMCTTMAGHHLCMSEDMAGRLSIFGLVWSLLLLLPFIIYIYGRLSPQRTFSSLVGSALRARSKHSLKRRCRRLGEEIISFSSDGHAVAEGLGQLLEFGIISARRNRGKGRLTADDVAECLSEELIYLTRQLSHETDASGQVLHTLEVWTKWLILGARSPWEQSETSHYVSAQRVGYVARLAVRSATRNLHLWENVSSAEACARESLSMIHGIAEACQMSKVGIRVRVSETAIALADCVAIKLVDGPRSDLNLGFRSLIKLCELTSRPALWSLGNKVVLREVVRALNIFSDAGASRNQLSPWILDELHNLMDGLSLSLDHAAMEGILKGISRLGDYEIKEIITGPSRTKRHTFRRTVNHSWVAVILKELYAAGKWGALTASRASAVGRCGNDSDLTGLISIFEQFAVEYDDDNGPDIQPWLEQTAGQISSCFKKRTVSPQRTTSDG